MPMASTFTHFIQARNSGRTNTVEVLEHIFNQIDDTHQHWAWFSQPRALDVAIPANVRSFLQSEGMIPGEIDHLDDWPANQKERIRRKIVDNILSSNRREVLMFWRVSQLNGETTEIDDPDPEERITITAFTPWGHIRISADGQHVTVDTGG